MGDVAWFLIGLGIGLWNGWGSAHLAVAAECRRLGGFFVGKTVFKCVEVIEQKTDE